MAAPTWTAGSQLRPSMEDVLGLSAVELSDPSPEVDAAGLVDLEFGRLVTGVDVTMPPIERIMSILDEPAPSPWADDREPRAGAMSRFGDILDTLDDVVVTPRQLRRPEPQASVDDVLEHLHGLAADAPAPSPASEVGPVVGAAPPAAARAVSFRQPRRRKRRLLVVGLAVAAVGAGSYQLATRPSDGKPVAVAAAPYALATRDAYTSLVAQARVAQLRVFADPGEVEEVQTLAHPTPNGGPLVFLVVDDSDAGWLEVQLPVRPNGSTGWVRRSDVTIRATRYRVVVSRGEHRLELYEGPELVFSTAIAVGTRDTPTPGGRFYLTELIQPPTPDTVYGRYVFGLSGFSNVLDEFNGGEGVIGIHGTNDPSVIGQDVSAGCIRLTNEAVDELVGRLPLGTPVEITA
ncbi:MAG: L,D-transpeptidase [Actinobacteria bacterium]|nr:L,D-transpeptidase [Actinomycetota bacterium]